MRKLLIFLFLILSNMFVHKEEKHIEIKTIDTTDDSIDWDI